MAGFRSWFQKHLPARGRGAFFVQAVVQTLLAVAHAFSSEYFLAAPLAALAVASFWFAFERNTTD